MHWIDKEEEEEEEEDLNGSRKRDEHLAYTAVKSIALFTFYLRSFFWMKKKHQN